MHELRSLHAKSVVHHKLKLRQMSPICAADVYYMCSRCLLYVLQMSTICAADVYHMCGTCLPYVRQMSTICAADVYYMCLPYMQQMSTIHACDIALCRLTSGSCIGCMHTAARFKVGTQGTGRDFTSRASARAALA